MRVGGAMSSLYFPGNSGRGQSDIATTSDPLKRALEIDWPMPVKAVSISPTTSLALLCIHTVLRV